MSRRVVAVVTALAALAALVGGCSDARKAEPGTPEVGVPARSATAATEVSLRAVVAAVEERAALYDDIATGLIVLVRTRGDTELVVRGRARTRPPLAMAPAMTFPIASITKMMTATVVMQLVEEGRLDLSAPARRWLPELRRLRPTITVEHLLSHRSGLRESDDADIRQHGLGSQGLLVAAASHPLDFEPGTDGLYSNVGYGALGLVVERVLGRPLDRILEERVFRPAGMTSSTLYGTPDVHGYADGEDMAGRYYLRLTPAAGSVVSTATDVDAFLRALRDGELVSREAVAQMHTPHGAVGYWSDYGLGLARDTFTCGNAWGHGGRLNGFSSEAWTLEDSDRTAVVVANDDGSEVVHGMAEAALCGG